MLRRLPLLALLVLPACAPSAPEPVPAPEVRYARNDAGELRAEVDAAQLERFLASRDLPVPSEPLEDVEGGIAEAMELALEELAQLANADAFGRVGMFFHRLERPTVARACYERAVELGDDAAAPVHWLHYLGDLAATAGELERACELFARATEREPRFNASRLRLARLLRERGDTEGAVAALREALSYEPMSLFALTELAAIQLERGEILAASELLLRANAGWPGHRRVLVLLAALERARGLEDEARKFEEQAARAPELSVLAADRRMAELETATNTLIAAKARADELAGAGRWEDYVALVRDIDRRQPNPVWRARAADGLIGIGYVDEAADVGRALVESEPDVALGHEVLARAELEAHRYESALDAAEDALALAPTSRIALDVSVRARLGLQDVDGALNAVDAVRRAYPDELTALTLELFVHRVAHDQAEAAGREADAQRHADEVRRCLDEAEARSPGAEAWAELRAWLDAH